MSAFDMQIGYKPHASTQRAYSRCSKGRACCRRSKLHDVIVEHEHHEGDQQEKPGPLNPELDLDGELPAHHPLDEEDQDVPAVERREGEDIEECETDAEHGHEPEERKDPELGRLRGELRDPDGPAHQLRKLGLPGDDIPDLLDRQRGVVHDVPDGLLSLYTKSGQEEEAKAWAVAAYDRWAAMQTKRATAAGFQVIDNYHAFNGPDGTAALVPAYLDPSSTMNAGGHDLYASQLTEIDLSAISDK